MGLSNNLFRKLRNSATVRSLVSVPFGFGGFSAKQYLKGEVDRPLLHAFVPPVLQFLPIKPIRPLLTVIVDSVGADAGATSYAEIPELQFGPNSRPPWTRLCAFQYLAKPLSYQDLEKILRSIATPYVLIISRQHEFSRSFLPNLLHTLRQQFIAPRFGLENSCIYEPRLFDTNIAPYFRLLKYNENYAKNRPLGIYGITFSTHHLRELFLVYPNLDITTAYLNYRIHFHDTKIKRIAAAYSVRSQKTRSHGIVLAGSTEILFATDNAIHQDIPNDLRAMIAKYLILLVRGAINEGASPISIARIKDALQAFSLESTLENQSINDRLETYFLQSLSDSERGPLRPFKELSDHLVTYSFTAELPHGVTPLQTIQFGRTRLHVIREYHKKASDGPYYRTPITQNSTILIFDRSSNADDNGEAFYRYIKANHPEFNNVYFALGTNSPDWPRLAKENFKLVPMFSKQFYELFLEADCVVSSQLYNLDYQGKNLSNSRFVYLQHGIQLNDMTRWISRKFFDVFVVTGALEASYMEQIAPKEVFNSGIPRLEMLYKKNLDTPPELRQDIIFLPTWRATLHAATNSEFVQTDFLTKVNEFLSDPRLESYLQRSGKRLLVKVHPNLEARSQLFYRSKYVRFVSDTYHDLFRTAALVVTDYSSAALDAAFIGVPIAYLQWDRDEFYSSQLYSPRLDYTIEGLGPVFETSYEMVRYIVDNQYQISDPDFVQRRLDFFKGVNASQINSKIFERMLKL